MFFFLTLGFLICRMQIRRSRNLRSVVSSRGREKPLPISSDASQQLVGTMAERFSASDSRSDG